MISRGSTQTVFFSIEPWWKTPTCPFWSVTVLVFALIYIFPSYLNFHYTCIFPILILVSLWAWFHCTVSAGDRGLFSLPGAVHMGRFPLAVPSSLLLGWAGPPVHWLRTPTPIAGLRHLRRLQVWDVACHPVG